MSDYNYILPKHLIASEPLKRRSDSKLMLLDRHNKKIKQNYFRDLPKFLNRGDLLILNDTKVFPAKLFGTKKTGGKVEILLCNLKNNGTWLVLGKNLSAGEKVIFKGIDLEAEVIEQNGKEAVLRFNKSDDDFWTIVDTHGCVPLPPYIAKINTKDDSFHRRRYQTVYAKNLGSVAAPTAGLHFTEQILKQLEKKGIKTSFLTLHVGLGTFLPVDKEDLKDHKMHKEYYSVSQQLIEQINITKKNGGRVVAVGTTTCRVLESVSQNSEYRMSNTAGAEPNIGPESCVSGWSDIFIFPPYQFKCVDGLITNFHLPKSTLLMLVSAFAGREFVMTAYEEAINEGYRFYSYGDAMLIL